MLQLKKIYKTLLKKKFITIKRNNDKLQKFLQPKNTKVKSGGSAMTQLTEIGKLDKEVYENNARITEYLVSLGKLYDIIVNKTDNITSGEITKLSKQLGLKEETVIALNIKVSNLQSEIKEYEKSSLQNRNLLQELEEKVNEQQKVIKKKIADLRKNEEVNVDLRKSKKNFQEKFLDIKLKNTELEKKISAMNLLETNLTTLQNERSKLIKERDGYKQQRDKAETTIIKSQLERDEIIKKLDQEEIELSKVRKELKDVKTELITATKSKGKKGKESPAKLRKMIKELKSDISSKEYQLSDAQKGWQRCENRWVKKNSSKRY